MRAKTKSGVEVFSLSKKNKKLELLVKKIGTDCLRRLKINLSVEIYLSGAPRMRSLNRKFRGKSYSANVLSFGENGDFVEPPSPKKRLGEIFLNISQISRFSAENRETEVARLIIHSLLHFLGYTHKKNSDRIEMENREKKILSEYAKNHNRSRHRLFGGKRSSRIRK